MLLTLLLLQAFVVVIHYYLTLFVAFEDGVGQGVQGQGSCSMGIHDIFGETDGARYFVNRGNQDAATEGDIADAWIEGSSA